MSRGGQAARVRAFAKINLSLHVLGARRDGYHELRTIFQSIALHDTITIRRSSGPFRIACNDPECPIDRTNLVWRAAEAMWKAAGRRGTPREIAVDIIKRVPVQSGLGGGSSDGAAAIRAFGALWRVDDRRQRAAAAALGADLPFFFEGGTVLGLERGDLLFPLIDRPAAWVALAVPAFGISTSVAFGWLDRTPRRRAKVNRGDQTAALSNDLQPPVADRHPEIERLVRTLQRRGADHAAMSGSGSAVFGIFARRSDAQRAIDALHANDRGEQFRLVTVTRTLTRAAHRRLAATQPIG